MISFKTLSIDVKSQRSKNLYKRSNHHSRKGERDAGGAGDKSTLKPPTTTKENRRQAAAKNKNDLSDSDSSDGSDDPSLPIPKRSKTKKESVPTTGEAATALIALSARKEDETATTPKQQSLSTQKDDDHIFCQVYLLPSSDAPIFLLDQSYPSVSCMVPRNATVIPSFGEVGITSDMSLPDIAYEAIQRALRVNRLTSMFTIDQCKKIFQSDMIPFKNFFSTSY